MEIRKITSEEATTIIEKREPRGRFYQKYRNVFVGIDNTTGDAWVEEFANLRNCKRWLSGGSVANLHGQIV